MQPVLTSSVRYNLLALQTHDKLMARTQERLATGLKVNKPTDDTRSYFTARNHAMRAQDITDLRRDVTNAINFIETAVKGLEAMLDIVDAMKAVADDAASYDTGAAGLALRAQNAGDFDQLRVQLQFTAQDATFNGTNLIGTAAGTNIVTNFNEGGTASFTLVTDDLHLETGGHGIAVAANAFAANADITAALTDLAGARTIFRNQIQSFTNALNIFNMRNEFNKDLVNLLEGASHELTVADINAESANAASLQTSQQIGMATLQMATSQGQQVLRLFN